MSKKFQASFGAGSDYDHAGKGIDLSNKPIKAPWMPHVLKCYLANCKGDGDIYNDSPMVS